MLLTYFISLPGILSIAVDTRSNQGVPISLDQLIRDAYALNSQVEQMLFEGDLLDDMSDSDLDSIVSGEVIDEEITSTTVSPTNQLLSGMLQRFDALNVAERFHGARNMTSDYLSGVSQYIWSGIGRVQEFASSWTTPTTTTTTTASPRTGRRIRRAVAATTAPKRRPVSIEEMYSLAEKNDKAKLSNFLRLYKIVKSKDPAKAAELLQQIRAIKSQMDARSYNRK